MTEPARPWPDRFAGLLAELEPCDHPGAYRADVELSDDALTELNLFEASVRHHRVLLPLPSGPVTAAMNALIGLGPPGDAARHAARVRVSFSDVQPAP